MTDYGSLRIIHKTTPFKQCTCGVIKIVRLKDGVLWGMCSHHKDIHFMYGEDFFIVSGMKWQYYKRLWYNYITMKNTKFEKADKKADKKQGIKEDGKADKKLDRKLPARKDGKNNLAKAMKGLKK